MPQNSALVSIVIPVYNGARYLGEAIDSALAQTYSPCEVIVVNDGSNDNGQTEMLALSYGSKIRYFSKPNAGVASALNFGIKAMKGEYFSWLSHDDVYYPWKIEIQMRIMKKAKRPVVLYGDYDIIDEDSHFIQKELLEHVSPSNFRIALIARSPVNGCTCLIPRVCFEKAGYFDESLKTTQDNELWFRMSKTFRFHHMRKSLIKSRIHAQQGSLVITTHTQEKSSYYNQCMQRLRADTAGRMVSFVFVMLAIKMKIAGLDEYSLKAIQICKENLRASHWSLKPFTYLLLAYFLIFHRRFMAGYVALAIKNRLLRRKANQYFVKVKRRADLAAGHTSSSQR